ncbi:Pkinase-domain-containing protein [Macrolepiota fuliginosa MF-IS2]|uniref:non-specific serine/threonine protein kinase n=1 Tax=Macrolepiota fuliginosa MF-IS2 TaxID=1400762 RepID=A0A9P6C9F1_9AGAR|nr:Pkinase-domain-containing protein [Macrolepiota fuliginosa MF-IS2]
MNSRPTSSSGSKANAPKTLNDYQLGDSLGKGAFGQVYRTYRSSRALNWATGETVAVKEIQLSNIPKAELGEIMSEIDLLKNLNHSNIVKYKGFVKTREYLYIILEFCENGSLHNIVKKFGKFPENLVAVYISQVLEGLVYLHDQGVIHRDIKGANILTNKDGTVKLADFGVASSVTAGAANAAVVGSPYWMAPEVIEQSGATTASDIWSVGCLVIELLEGHPPYHDLDPMPALFRIVQDDCPPIPDGASPIVKDFLYHCFQKDCNLRISAKKLLKHPWMISARKQLAEGKNKAGDSAEPKAGSEGAKKPSNYNFDEALAKVQEWNEALKSPSRPSKHPSRYTRPVSPTRGSDLPLSSSILGHSTGPSAWKVVPGPSSRQPNAEGGVGLVGKIQPLSFATLQAPEEQTDNWDDDFEEGISFTKLQALERTSTDEEKEDKTEDLNAQTIRPTKSPGTRPVPLAIPPSAEISPIVEDYSDLAAEEDEEWLEGKVADFKMKNSVRKGLFHPDDIKTVGLAASPGPLSAPLPGLSRKSSRPGLSTVNGNSQRSVSSGGGSFGRADAKKAQTAGDSEKFDKYAEVDDEDYEDVFGKPNGTNIEPSMQSLRLNTRLSNKSWRGEEDSDEEDPFAEIDEGFSEDDLDTNLQRDKYARLCNTVNQLIDELTPSAPEFQLQNACNQIIEIMEENPEMQSQLVSSHGMLAILEVLEVRRHRDVTMKLMQIINLLVTSDIGFLESFCLIGGIPVMMEFTSKKYPSACRLEASNFIRLLCHTSVLTLQMFISCRGLKVLVDLLDEDYTEQEELVVNALDGIGSVFELQSPTTKNDFCRMFIREGLLDPLSLALLNVMAIRGEKTLETKMKIIPTLLVFCQVSQSDVHVRNALGTRQVIRRLLRACELLEPECLVLMLKAVKHLSMSATLLEVLQNANAIEVLIRILEEHSSGTHSTEMSNHIFQTCYNLCRLNKTRQEEAAQAGIIPCLKRVIETSSPLKQFALPILCDLAGAGKSCRNLLWQHEGLRMYLKLLDDPYFQVSALESVLSWLQDETARVEDHLLKPEALDALVKCFVHSKAVSFENLLDPFLKLTRISTPLTLAITKSSSFFKRIIDRLGHNGKAVVRLNLLKLLRSIVEVHPNRALLVERYGLLEVVEKLSKGDGAVLVRELAREIVPTLRPVLMRSSIGPGGGSGHATPMVHKLKARAESVDRGNREPSIRERGERERIGREKDKFGFEGGSSPGLRASVSSIGGVTPKLKVREDGFSGELRERDGYREKVVLVSRKMRRAASEASATPLTLGNGGPRRPSVLQAPSESMAKSGRDRRFVSGLGLGLAPSLDRSTNAPPISTASHATAASVLGGSHYKPRHSKQKLDDVAAWLEQDSGLETD